MAAHHRPGLALGVYLDGKIIKAAGYGFANLELKVPVTPESVFHTESVAKIFTAISVMMLVEEGKVSLDDSITKYFPEAPQTWKPVKIRHLLTHTSGSPDYMEEEVDKFSAFINPRKDYTEDELLRALYAQPLQFAPGDQRRYNNAGFVILGALIRRVTGQSWIDFQQKRIFQPLGMTATRIISEADIIPNRVSGYSLVEGEWKNPEWSAPSLSAVADGCLYSNVLDMAKWDAALYGEKLLKRSTLEQMLAPVTLNSGKTYPNGFAWLTEDVNGHRLVYHDGEFNAFTTDLSRYLDDHLTIMIFTNLGVSDSFPKYLADKIGALYLPALAKKDDLTGTAAVMKANSSTRGVPASR